MAAKLLNLANESGVSVYAIIQRESDGFILNDADGSFAASPVDLYKALAENLLIRGLYQASENRIPWQDDGYYVVYYEQLGGAPDPTLDNVLAGGFLETINDEEVTPAGLSVDISAAIGAIVRLSENSREGFLDLRRVLAQLRLLTTAVEKRAALKI